MPLLLLLPLVGAAGLGVGIGLTGGMRRLVQLGWMVGGVYLVHKYG